MGEHKVVTKQIISLRSEIESLNNEIGDIEGKLSAIDDPSVKLNEKIDSLKEAVNARADRTQIWANEIESLSREKIKAVVDKHGDITQIYEALDQMASKTGSQEATRIKEISKFLEEDTIWNLLDRLRADAIKLLHWSELGNSIGEDDPDISDLATILGNTEKIKSALVDLVDVFRVGVISIAVPNPQISLYYCDKDKEISFGKASEGQRAAAILFMLLEQGGGPLVIDQPEGDLDNKIISDLTELLHHAKAKRQLIFASHNANIVVNGASEFVGYIAVNNDGERSFEATGAIDNPKICSLITSTMEGGEKAFRDRKDKYGY